MPLCQRDCPARPKLPLHHLLAVSLNYLPRLNYHAFFQCSLLTRITATEVARHRSRRRQRRPKKTSSRRQRRSFLRLSRVLLNRKRLCINIVYEEQQYGVLFLLDIMQMDVGLGSGFLSFVSGKHYRSQVLD